MRAAVVEEFGAPLKVHENWTDPECGPRDAILKVEACGICRSDHTIWEGGAPWVGLVPELPAVLGHEYCGIVEEVGSEVTRFKKGDRVVAPFNHACGTCAFCESGHQNVCANVQVPSMHYTGAYASHAKVANADVNLVTLPESIDFASAAGLGCRFITAYHGVVDVARVQPGEWVAVFACGGVGLSAVNIAAGLGAQVIAVARSEDKLSMARQLGASHTLAAGPDNPDQIRELTGGGAHVSVDALGAASTALPAIMSLRPLGRHLRLGISNHDEQGMINIPVDILVFQELSLLGSWGMQAARFPEMLERIESGALNPDVMVRDTVSLDGASDVLMSMGDYDTVGMSVITEF